MPPEYGAELDGALDEAAGALEEVREIAGGLHPMVLSEQGLGPPLETLASRSPVPVTLGLRAEGRLPGQVEVSAYYVVAEALTNAAKHAHASSVSVEIETVGDVLSVTVRDDGTGGAKVSGGTGLVGLKDRVEAVGGRISLDSAPGAGTSLRAEIPLNRR
jgi:signal transduction histidine kinase